MVLALLKDKTGGSLQYCKLKSGRKIRPFLPDITFLNIQQCIFLKDLPGVFFKVLG